MTHAGAFHRNVFRYQSRETIRVNDTRGGVIRLVVTLLKNAEEDEDRSDLHICTSDGLAMAMSMNSFLKIKGVPRRKRSV